MFEWFSCVSWGKEHNSESEKISGVFLTKLNRNQWPALHLCLMRAVQGDINCHQCKTSESSANCDQTVRYPLRVNVGARFGEERRLYSMENEKRASPILLKVITENDNAWTSSLCVEEILYYHSGNTSDFFIDICHSRSTGHWYCTQYFCKHSPGKPGMYLFTLICDKVTQGYTEEYFL